MLCESIQKGVVNMSKTRKVRPALSQEARENQLISMAMDEAERRILDGTASSQLLCEFIKRGSMKAQMEIEKLQEENKLLRAKTENLQSQQRVEELYKEALDAMRNYAGYSNDDDFGDGYEY